MNIKVEFENLFTVMNEIEFRKQDLINKKRIFLNRVCQRMITLIEAYSAGAVSDELYEEHRSKGIYTYTPANKYSKPYACTYEVGNKTCRVAVQAEDLFFIEFGAGHFATGLNPLSDEVSFSTERGSYGHGLGVLDSWHFTDEQGRRLKSTGTPATMPIFKAIEQTKAELPNIFRGVYG